jgi:hypothetical protein
MRFSAHLSNTSAAEGVAGVSCAPPLLPPPPAGAAPAAPGAARAAARLQAMTWYSRCPGGCGLLLLLLLLPGGLSGAAVAPGARALAASGRGLPLLLLTGDRPASE